MEQSNLLELAKQGEPNAIAALMNAVLKPKGITAQARFEQEVLCIALESPKPLNQDTLVTFIRKGLLELGNQSIQTVRAQGKRTGEKDFTWTKEFFVHPVPTVVAEPEVSPIPPGSTDAVPSESKSALSAPEMTPESPVTPEDSSQPEKETPVEVDSGVAIAEDVASDAEPTEEGLTLTAAEESSEVATDETPEIEIADEDEALEEEAIDDELEPQSLRAWIKLHWRVYSLPVLLVIVGGFFAGGTMAFWSTSKVQNQDFGEELFQPREQTAENKQSEAEKYLKAMNKAQEEFFQKHKRFAKSLEELERSANLIAQSYSYAYRLRVTESAKSTQGNRSLITASPRETGLQSYVGAVFVLPTGTSSIICQTPKPSMQAPAAPQVVKKKLGCAPRSIKVQ